MSADTPHNGDFSLIFHAILEDEKFAEVYEDDALFACWVRLLMAADKAYPSPAPVPFGTDSVVFGRLCEIGLLVSLAHHHYIVKGMAAERERRKKRRSDAAREGWERRNATQGDAQ